MATWKSIPGFAGLYEISDGGAVRSLDRYANGMRKGRVLKQSIKAKGYRQVTLCREDGTRASFFVHRLVAQAFIGPCAFGEVVRHLDDQPSNNRLINIAYGTHLHNAQDKKRLGTQTKGERHSMAKLTESEVRFILVQDLSRFGSTAKLARQFGVTPSHVAAIRAGKTWKHLHTSEAH